MTEKSFIDVFQLCWDVIREESSAYNGTVFGFEHCKISDTIDTNFAVVENRLAYTYKYGSYNILFFEKCVLNFVNDCLDLEAVFPLKKLKVCSLSNGPGFDIIGLLCALCKSNRTLKSFPELNAVNVFDSWQTLYKTLVHKAYEIINLNFKEYPPIKPKKISLIQGDVFSALSTETKNCITKSNVLLMVKVYFNSKASVNKFAKSLKKIFLLLKPGALIFFVGSEKNINNFNRRPFLGAYVKSIYGPQKMTLDNVDEKIVGQKSFSYGCAEFVVWQKKTSSDIAESIEALNKKYNKGKVLKNTGKGNLPLSESIVQEQFGDTIVEANFNFSSDEESEFSIPQTLSQSDNILSDDNVASILDKVESEPAYYGSFQQNLFQFPGDNISALIDETRKNSHTSSLKNGMSDAINGASSLSYDNYETSFDVIKGINMQVPKITTEEISGNLNFEYAESASKSAKFVPRTQCMNDEAAVQNTCIKKTNENVVQSMHGITGRHNEMNSRNSIEMAFQKNLSSFKQSFEDLVLDERSVTASTSRSVSKSSENLHDADKPSLHSLVQKCEDLVTAVEKLVNSVKCDVDSSKNYSGCQFGQTCTNSEISHHCCCCVKVIHTCCCRKLCSG